MTTLTDKALAKSWYREPWPWLLMSGPCAVIIAGFFTLWLAVKSDDGLVADDYYKRGLAINQTLSRAARAEQLALTARVEFRAESRHVRAVVNGTGTLPTTLRLRLVHPTQAAADEMIELQAMGAGTYEGTVAGGPAGRGVVVLEDAARTWRLAGKAGGASQSVTLTPQ
jgi:uncharacterized protein